MRGHRVRTTAIVNQKGGSGKTTTAINIAAICARRGMRTLLVDVDPQSHCAVGLGVPEKMLDMTIAEALLASHDDTFDEDALLWEVNRNLHLAPSTIRLATLEAPGGGLHERPDKDRRLESLLRRLSHRFDRCFIDCPPTIGLLTFNALRASREAIIPVETGFFALRGAEKQWQTIQRLIAHINQPIACHLLATLHDPSSRISCDILAALRRDFAGQIVPIVIEASEALREAVSFGQPVHEYAPDSPAVDQFESLVNWLEEHAASGPPEIEVLRQDDATTPGTGRSPSPTTAPVVASERAAELARRVNSLARRHLTRDPVQDASTTTTTTSAATEPASPLSPPVWAPPAAPSASPFVPPVPPVANAVPPRPVPPASAFLGVRPTPDAVLFVQRADVGQTVAIAGDFNGWSPAATYMTLNREAGILEARLRLSPGRHQYRLVVDGHWRTDEHNPMTAPNPHGEANSVVIVPSREGAPT